MTDGEALRAAIRAAPHDATPRLVYADWLDENGDAAGELVRLLCEPAFRTHRDVMDWFHRTAGWPLPDRGQIRGWLFDALKPDRWPSRDALKGCVAAMVGRLLPGARRWLAGENPYRRSLEEVMEWPDTILTSLELLHGITGAAELLLSAPGDGPGDASNGELAEQVHVVGWSWLGLPPLVPPVPESAAEPFFDVNPPPEPPPARSWWQRLFGG